MSATTRSTSSGSEPGTNIGRTKASSRRPEVLAERPHEFLGLLGRARHRRECGTCRPRRAPRRGRAARALRRRSRRLPSSGRSARHRAVPASRSRPRHRRRRRASSTARRPPPDSPCPARSTATTSCARGKVVDLPRSSRFGRTTTRGRTPTPARPHLRPRNARECRQRSERCPSSRCYLATSTARLSLITITFTWPGYSSWSSISRAISCERRTAASSSTSVGSTITRISRPAWSA